MRTKTLLFFTYLAFCISSTFANTVTIESLNELSEEWSEANENTLVIFDIDEVLITTEDHFMHPYAKSITLPLILKFILNATSKTEKKSIEESLSLSYLLTKKILIEESSPSLIKMLQEKNVSVIALTNSPTGPLGLIPEAATWKVNLLKEFDIHFSFFEFDRFFIETESLNKVEPLLEQGILFVKGHEKGDVLKSLFKQCNFYPLKVIFVDDLLNNIENVQSAMKSLGIECRAYHYSGANRFFKKEADKNMLKYQFEYLLEKKEWLTDRQLESSY